MTKSYYIYNHERSLQEIMYTKFYSRNTKKLFFIVIANRSLVSQYRGLALHSVQLQGGWPEDDTDSPPLSTAATSQTPHSESGTERRMMAGMTSQDACNTQHTISEYSTVGTIFTSS